MLKEAFEFLTNLGRTQAVGSILVPPKGTEPEHIYFLRDANGKIERMVAESEPRNDEAQSLIPIVDFAIENKATAEIWYSRNMVSVTLDRRTRRDCVNFKPILSAQIIALQHLEKNKPHIRQPDLIKELRVTFNGCLNSNLIDILKRVKFTNGSTIEMETTKTKASIGKQIMADVTGTADIPDDFKLVVPVFSNAFFAPLRQSVTVALEPDPANGTFQVIPYPQEVEKAIAAGEEYIRLQIGGMLKDAGVENVPVYNG
jgi:hypothetical protein